MIMYKVSKKFAMVQFKEIEVISETKKTVTYFSEMHGRNKNSLKQTSDTEWLTSKEKAIELAREWAEIKIGSAQLALNLAEKSLDRIELIALGEEK